MSKKKDFTSPSISFISPESIEKVEGPQPEAKRTEEEQSTYYKVVEAKSKRVQLLIRPSLYEEAKATAGKLGVSFNEFVHRAIQEATDKAKEK